MKYALAFGVLAIVCGVQVWQVESGLARLLWLNLALCCGGLSAAYGSGSARILGKKADGIIAVWSGLFFWPYFALNALCLWLVSLLKRQAAVHEIAPGLFLGQRPMDTNPLWSFTVPPYAVLDLTCEFAEPLLLRSSPAYLSLPLLDTFAPSQAELQAGVAFLQRYSKPGTAFVHCALGHGRSATFAAAFLLDSGLASDAESAEQLVKAKRPSVRLSSVQRQALQAFATNLVASGNKPTMSVYVDPAIEQGEG